MSGDLITLDAQLLRLHEGLPFSHEGFFGFEDLFDHMVALEVAMDIPLKAYVLKSLFPELEEVLKVYVVKLPLETKLIPSPV